MTGRPVQKREFSSAKKNWGHEKGVARRRQRRLVRGLGGGPAGKKRGQKAKRDIKARYSAKRGSYANQINQRKDRGHGLWSTRPKTLLTEKRGPHRTLKGHVGPHRPARVLEKKRLTNVEVRELSTFGTASRGTRVKRKITKAHGRSGENYFDTRDEKGKAGKLAGRKLHTRKKPHHSRHVRKTTAKRGESQP